MQVKTEIRKFIIENFLYGQDDGTLSDDVSFLENGIIDSTGVLELVSFAQEAFELQVSDAELIPVNFDSVNKMEAFIRHKLLLKDQELSAGAQAPIPVH